MLKKIENYFCNDKSTIFFQVVVSFATGLFFSPWAYSVIFIILFLIVYEIIFYYFTFNNKKYHNTFCRCSVILAYILGYIVGRTLIKKEILI